MIQTNCKKCGSDLILHEGYGVCSKCGEIIGFDVEEEPEEIAKEIISSEAVAEEVEDSLSHEETVIEKTSEKPNEESTEHEEVLDEISGNAIADEEPVCEETEEEITDKVKEENIAPEEIKNPKKKKTPIVILAVVILCTLAVLGGYLIFNTNQDIKNTDTENIVPKQDITEEKKDPQVIDEEVKTETEEPVIKQEKTSAPVTTKSEAPKKETVKKEDAVISNTPKISYRIRQSADAFETQIGAFSDLERAKAFAEAHAADGYKVFDMHGNIVFEP